MFVCVFVVCFVGGVCNNSSHECECDEWWTGDDCHELHLAEAKRVNGINLAVSTSTWTQLPNHTHTWCTSVHADPIRGDHFAVISYLLNHCNLDSWTTNSEVALLRSAVGPEGPYDIGTLRALIPPFAHNPKAIRYVDGTWLLFWIGSVNGTSKPANCSLNRNQEQENLEGDINEAVTAPSPGNDGIRVAWANTSSGPWTLYNHGLPLFAPNSSRWYSRTVTNPAPLVLANGTILMYFTGNSDSNRCPHTGNCIGMARAPHWTGPWEVVSTDGAITSPDAEDPFAFRDLRGHYHLLMNTNTGHWVNTHTGRLG